MFQTKRLLASLVLLGIKAHGQPACLEQQTVREIREQVSVTVGENSSPDICAGNSNAYLAFEALALIKALHSESPSALKKPFNQGILPTDFWTYFSARAQQMIEDEGNCPEGMLAYVLSKANDGVIRTCADFYSPSVSKYERAEVLLHELRHFDQFDSKTGVAPFDHVECTRGPRQFSVARICDDSIAEQGSYAVSVEALTKMSNNAGAIPTVQRSMLKTLALALSYEAFNQPVQPHDTTAIYLVDTQHRAYLYSDQGLTPVALLANSQVISRGRALAVFPLDKSNAYTADVFSPNLSPLAADGSFSLEYNSLPPARRPTVVDILNDDFVRATVVSDKIVGNLTGRQESSEIPVSFPIKAAYSAAEVGLNDHDSIFVTDRRDQMYRVQFLRGGTSYIQPVENPLVNLRQVAIFNSARIALNSVGELIVEQRGQWVKVPELSDKKFLSMTRPFLWDESFAEGTQISASVL